MVFFTLVRVRVCYPTCLRLILYEFHPLKKPLIWMCHAYFGPTSLSNTSAAQSTHAVNSPATDETVPSSVTEDRRVFNYSVRGGRSFQPKA